MFRGPWCSLCGGIFEPIEDNEDRFRPRKLTWTQRACLVKSERFVPGSQIPTLRAPVESASGYIAPRSKLVARVNNIPESPLVDGAAELDDTLERELHDLSGYCYGFRPFAFHTFCWEILLVSLGVPSDDGLQQRDVCYKLFHFLSDLPWSRGGEVLPKHRFYGAADLRQCQEGIEFLRSDPTQNIFPIPYSKLDETVDGSSSSHRPDTLADSLPPKVNDIFSKLSPEIIHRTLTFLSSPDVCSARLSSHYIAIHAGERQLPPSFWASRLSEARMGFVIGHPSLEPEPSFKSWRALYRCCKKALQSNTGFACFQNRWRIAQCIKGLSSALGLLLTTVDRLHPSGQYDRNGPQLPQSEQLGQRVACPVLPEDSRCSDLSFGVRPRKKHVVYFKTEGSTEGCHLDVSMLSLNGRTYISGIRICRGNESAEAQSIQHAGHLTSSTIVSCCVDATDSISRVDAYISVNGIHGLRFIIRKSDGTEASHEAGEVHCPDSMTAVTTLESPRTILGLCLGFDTCKLISVQFIETSSPCLRVSGSTSLWSPAFPPKDSELSQTDQPDPQGYFPINLYIPFGGRHGSLLSSLCRFTVVWYGVFGVYGLAMAYDNGDEVWYGRRKALRIEGEEQFGVEQSFLLNGRKGERINRIATSFQDLKSTTWQSYEATTMRFLSAIEVSTNFGRSYRFHAFNIYGPPTEDHVQVLTPQSSHVLIALTARTNGPHWKFEKLGIQTLTSREPTTQPIPEPRRSPRTDPTKRMIKIGYWMLWREGCCCTTGSLSCVRRVRVSTGVVGRSRGRRHISGIQLEYEDDMDNIILGQWMVELGSFSVAPHESLVEISTWIEQENVLDVDPPMLLGKVLGIGFRTSTGKCYEFRPGTQEFAARVNHRATAYESLGDLTWMFNGPLDDIQVQLRPTGHIAAGRLEFYREGKVPTPFNLSEDDTRTSLKYPTQHRRDDEEDEDELGNDSDESEEEIYDDHYPIHQYDDDEEEEDQSLVRYGYVRQAFFWDEIDQQDGSILLHVRKVSMTVDCTGLVGVEFQYGSSVSRSYGVNKGTTYSLLMDDAHEKLSLLVVYTCQEGIKGLELHTNKGQVCRAVSGDSDHLRITTYSLIQGTQASSQAQEHWGAVPTEHFDVPVDSNETTTRSSVGLWLMARHENSGMTPLVGALGPISLTTP